MLNFVVYFMQNPVVYRTGKKKCFAICKLLYVSLNHHSFAAAHTT